MTPKRKVVGRRRATSRFFVRECRLGGTNSDVLPKEEVCDRLPLEQLMKISAPNLTKQAPRSPRVRLGGYVTLPRILDKGRATLVSMNGEYNFDCPLDRRFFEFVGIPAAALKKQLAAGKGDGEILEWIHANAKFKRTEPEIAAWSAQAEQRVPTNPESREYFNTNHKKYGPKREDIATFFDLLDLDDYVSFGGKA